MRRIKNELQNSGDIMIGVKVAPRHERSENNANNAICQIIIEYSLKNLYNIGKIKKLIRE